MSLVLNGAQAQRLKFVLSRELEHLVQEKNWIVLKVRAEELYSIFDNDTARTPDEVFGTDMEVFREIEREAALAELKLVHSPVRHPTRSTLSLF